ncbi:hypothetical protein pW2_189 [Bacillus phage pW2]|uniref:Uncharacterized protein n=1 Tax=Bacillus phage pW2 TaxID=2500559 RepID=A0A3Q9R7V0_9CAUD|nr:hypothetical protein PQE69_gp123 [Bacillus phage pW2]AZU98995.1 hypothetical protein pW2_189 [Bacillus phage pW2]
MRKWEEKGFSPPASGGLVGYLTTEKGLFYVYSINKDIDDIGFDYSKTGDKYDLVKSFELEIYYDEDFFDRMKPHVQEVLKELGVDKRAFKLYDEWEKEIDRVLGKRVFE